MILFVCGSVLLPIALVALGAFVLGSRPASRGGGRDFTITGIAYVIMGIVVAVLLAAMFLLSEGIL